MIRKLIPLGLSILLMLAVVPFMPVRAQDGSNASTAYQLNMRAGAGSNYNIVTTLPSGTPLVLEARNADTSWVLGHTVDNAHRGWLASLYLSYPPGFTAAGLPVSTEVLNAPAAAAEQSAPAEETTQQQQASTGGVGAFTSYQMNVRSGPGTNHSAVGQIPANTGFVLEARNGDSSWVLGHTEDGSLRGWLASLYLKFSVSAASLPYSEEIIAPPATSIENAATGATGYDGINLGNFNLASVEGIDLTAVPVVGGATGTARAIFQNGRAMGNNPNVVTTVGDCSSEHWKFLSQFAWGNYNLGAYANLQPVIDHFGESLAYDSQADHNGFNANAVIAPEWANPGYCQAGESPLLCEFRIHKPSVAVIMFGTSDLIVMAPAEFDFYMREMVKKTIEAGVIPILSTFPGNLNFWNRTILYNQIVVRIAQDYDIPLINLWLALENLPNHGLEADGFHLGESAYGTSCMLMEPYLQSGYPMRNLVTMQTLDNVWRGAMQ